MGPTRSVMRWRCCGCERFIQGVLDESVAEVIAPGYAGQLAHQRNRRGRVENIEEIVFRRPRRASQELEIEVSADDRSDRQPPMGVCPQTADPRADHDAQ